MLEIFEKRIHLNIILHCKTGVRVPKLGVRVTQVCQSFSLIGTIEPSIFDWNEMGGPTNFQACQPTSHSPLLLPLALVRAPLAVGQGVPVDGLSPKLHERPGQTMAVTKEVVTVQRPEVKYSLSPSSSDQLLEQHLSDMAPMTAPYSSVSTRHACHRGFIGSKLRLMGVGWGTLISCHEKQSNQ